MEIKEITVGEFVEMCEKYFTDSTVSDLTMLKEWIVDQKMTGFEKHRFYYHVIYNHKYRKFPTLAHFVDYFKEFKPNDTQRDTSLTDLNSREMSRWNTFSTEAIINILIKINEKEPCKYLMGEVFFLEKYGRLYSEMRYLQERNYPKDYIRSKIQSYREKIDQGLRIIPEDGDAKFDEFQAVPFEEVR